MPTKPSRAKQIRALADKRDADKDAARRAYTRRNVDAAGNPAAHCGPEWEAFVGKCTEIQRSYDEAVSKIPADKDEDE